MKRAAILYVFLTLLVWGLFAFDQGLFHDDASNLAWAQRAASTPGSGFLEPITAPTRRLLGVPYILAWASPAPAAVLQLFLGVCWLLSGFAVFALARELFPSSRAFALVAGALSVTATSDLLTNTGTAIGYCFSGLTLAAALTAALRFQETGQPLALVAAALVLNAGLLASDGATPAAALAPLLFLAVRGRADRRWAVNGGRLAPLPRPLRRRLRPLPEGSRLSTRRSRSSRALRSHARVSPPRSSRTRSCRGGGRSAGPSGSSTCPRSFPSGSTSSRRSPEPPRSWRRPQWKARNRESLFSDPERRRSWRVAAVLVLMIAATHLVFSGVQLAEVRYRTHLVTRLFTSLLLALAAGVAARRLRAPRLALALPVLFVGLGVAGGVERQDTYLATWRRQRAELSSIFQAVPALDPRATLVLSLVPDPGGFQATRVPYLASAWMSHPPGRPVRRRANRRLAAPLGRGLQARRRGPVLRRRFRLEGVRLGQTRRSRLRRAVPPVQAHRGLPGGRGRVPTAGADPAHAASGAGAPAPRRPASPRPPRQLK